MGLSVGRTALFMSSISKIWVRAIIRRVAHDIDPHIPVWDQGTREDGTFSRAEFIYDQERGLYICPGGKTLKTAGGVLDGKTLYYRASKFDCEACPSRLGAGPRPQRAGRAGPAKDLWYQTSSHSRRIAALSRSSSGVPSKTISPWPIT